MLFFIIVLIGIKYSLRAQPAAFPGENPLIESGMPMGSFAEFGLDSVQLYRKVDSLMDLGINQQAFPGAQLLVAYKGKTLFHHAYGFHTYDSLERVERRDLYDLASVTKIAAALPALMKLNQEGTLNLDSPLSDYWKPWKRRKDKRELTLREILAHQAGLLPYIVFLNDALRKGELKRRFVRETPSGRFSLQAYENLYVSRGFVRKMHRKINRSEVSPEKAYRYSGLSFLLVPELVESLDGRTFETYLQAEIYGPMGITGLTFLPKIRMSDARVVPTEFDSLYRKTLTRGWVHDENASLMGGISGNAGLFGRAEDLAVLMQCYANYGSWKGQQILDSSLVAEYIRVQFPENENRRGLGFDKPLPENGQLPLEEAYPATRVSPESFGHSGFTGTFVWADPINHLVYIFLSNRVYPSRSHRGLYDLKLRTKLQQLFYEAVLGPEGL
jgi:CubicO group peptidase (beta-lactamase class C family)